MANWLREEISHILDDIGGWPKWKQKKFEEQVKKFLSYVAIRHPVDIVPTAQTWLEEPNL